MSRKRTGREGKGRERMTGQNRREERGDGEEEIGGTERHREEKFKESQMRRYHNTNCNCALLQ